MRRVGLGRVGRAVVGLCAWASGVGAENPVTIGSKEVVYTAETRRALGLAYWPDGNLGVVPDSSGGYWFYAANGSGSVRTHGSLADPAAGGVTDCAPTGGATLNYKAGGPVYRDAVTGQLLQFYHAETHPGGDPRHFYSALGLAVSDCAGAAFRDCGLILQANLGRALADSLGEVVEMCGAPFVVHDGYFWVYYRDTLADASVVHLCVARAAVRDVVTAALAEFAVPWQKYHAGAFAQQGDGGVSSALEAGNPPVRWMDVKWCSAFSRYVAVMAVGWPNPDLHVAWSPDGLNWSSRTRIENEPGESFYPTLVGLGPDPQELGRSFYVYYTYSALGDWSRWGDAELVRRLVTVSEDRSTGDEAPVR